MKVSELIELLQGFDGDMEVKYTYNYGDYWRTCVADNITMVDEARVKYSDYHNMDKVIEYDDDDYHSKDAKKVVILG